MQHKCVKCGKVYEKGSEEILNGCTCGSKLFYFLKSGSKGKKGKEALKDDSDSMDYFYELEDDENQEMMVFDIEAINVKSSGKYELNIQSLMDNDGLIYRYGDGKYSIDIDRTLKNSRKN
jgi:hypothetical protein